MKILNGRGGSALDVSWDIDRPAEELPPQERNQWPYPKSTPAARPRARGTSSEGSRRSGLLRQFALRRDHPGCTRPARSSSSAAPSLRLHRRARGRHRLPRGGCELFAQKKSITTFGPYSPGQAVVMKRDRHRGDSYRRFWATPRRVDWKRGIRGQPQPSVEPGARGGRRPGAGAADRRSQPAVPAAADDQRTTRASADRLSAVHHRRRRHRPRCAIHVRNLIRRFVEAGVPGYHIGTSGRAPRSAPPGRQGARGVRRAAQTLNTARFQLDIMGVPGIIVARTDAEAANLIDSRDERDQPFLLGVTNLNTIPSYSRDARADARFHDRASPTWGAPSCSTRCPKARTPAPTPGWTATPSRALVDEPSRGSADPAQSVDAGFDGGSRDEAWQAERAQHLREAVAEVPQFRARARRPRWPRGMAQFAARARVHRRRRPANSAAPTCVGLRARQPPRLLPGARRIPYAINKSLAAAPFADIRMETRRRPGRCAGVRRGDPRRIPDQMLAYNLSPSFNWDNSPG